MTSAQKQFIVFGLQAILALTPRAVLATTVCCSCKGPPDPTTVACLTGDPDKDKFNGEDCTTVVAAAKLPEGWSCEKSPLSESKCRSVSDGGVCAKPPTSMFTYAAPQSEAPARQGVTTVENVRPKKDGGKGDIIPTLNVAIPGLTFSGGAGLTFGEYVAGANRYIISIVAVAATVMFIYGAFLYLVGTAIESIRSGKQIMTDAVVGMLLVLGAYLILSTINPATVKIKPLEVRQVTTDAFTDPAAERARVEQSGAVGPTGVPFVNEETGEVTGGQSSFEIWKASRGVAREPSGAVVAQGKCPTDMIAIKNSPTYTRAKVDSFCIDRYEAPNQKGAYPIIGVLDWEADWYCDLIGKRLCTTNEWQRACMGPDGKNLYGYGPTYIPGKIIVGTNTKGELIPVSTGQGSAPCNYDSQAIGYVDARTDAILRVTFPAPNNRVHSILNPDNPALQDPTPRYKRTSVENGKFVYNEKISYAEAFELLKAEEARLTNGGVEPSGNRKDCVTAEGVYDMTANVQEVTLKDNDKFKNMTADDRFGLGNVSGKNKPYQWVGFYFSPISHLGGGVGQKPICTAAPGGEHNVAWRPFENGFRCCMGLQETGTAPSETGTSQ